MIVGVVRLVPFERQRNDFADKGKECPGFGPIGALLRQ